MGLKEYVKKRDFKKTSEPKAGASKDKDHLIFVVQKHDASRLHYDFRLEMDGVLKSWAVPKGPMLDPKVKHLAMMVEDHPFDYLNFEGIIPEGEYGGGTVIVWDEGTYEPIEPIKGKKAQEKALLKQLASGQLKIKLHGEKLNGEFALVKTHGMGENAWLMIKHKDEFATGEDVTKQDQSVLSGKTIETMAKTSEKVWQHGHEEDVVPDQELADEVETTEPETTKADVAKILKSAPKSKVPANIKPMKATLVDEPFDEPGWLFEVKWDGYRAVANLSKKDGVQLISRNNLPFDKYYPINDALKNWKMDAVLDGELLVLNEKGISDFGAMQNWRSEADGNLVYYIFDILWYEGKNLMGLPLSERQAVLQSILPIDNDHIRQSKVFDANGIDFFAAAERMGLEGIIAKKANSAYTSDLRSKEWLKVKVQRRQEVVIAGFTKNEGTGKSFSALVLGVYDNKGDLQFVGKVGTGFSDKLQKEMMAQFKPLITNKSPFDYEVDVDKPTRFRPKRLGAKHTWLKPELVCEVGFAEVTSDGVFRQASFKGMRTDKNAKDVILETPAATDDTVAEVDDKTAKQTAAKKSKTDKKPDLALAPVKNTERKTLLNPTEDTQVKKICGHELKFNHVTKLYWPEDKITKGQMLNYYYKVGEYMMPYLKDRPMSLNRFPGGIHGQSFYQKNVTDKAPDWAITFDHVTDEGKVTKYLVGTDEASLLWMASLGCIEINPWFSRAQTPDNPDYCVIDLDPDKHTYDQVVEAARITKDILDAIDVPSYPKTSGSTGMHIYIPLEGKYSYQQSQLFANIIVKLVHKQIPDYTSLERSIAARNGKMYLDFLQNRPGATIAGPYSLRPKPGATVSTPLNWDEVKPGLTIQHFNINNAIDRFKEVGDLFQGVLGEGIDLGKTIKKAQSIFLKNRRMKHGLMIDMDGVIYAGEELINGADAFVKRLLKDKIPFTFLSNNSSKSRADAVEKLAKMGIDVTEEHIYTSAMATATFLTEHFPDCSVHVLGEGGLLKSLKNAGIRMTDKKPDLVILGEGQEFSLDKVHKAVDMILAGARFIATNRDPSPRREGWNNLGIAATAAMIEEASGREPFVIGKPSPVMMRSAATYMGLKPEDVTVIGDTMETDIIGGIYMGFKTILVLSGIADKAQLIKYGYRPHMVVDTVDKIEFPLAWWTKKR